MNPSPRPALLAPLLATATALVALAARPAARSAPADAPDWPVAVSSSPSDGLIVAMQADVANAGGIVRLGPDCTPIAVWRTGSLLDVAADPGAVPRTWAIEQRREDGQARVQVVRFAASGPRMAAWDVGEGARYLAARSLGGADARELYVAHGATEGRGAHVMVHDRDGRVLGGWDLPGEPRGVAVADGASSSGDAPIYVALAAASGGAGSLHQYARDGRLVWERSLDLVPAALDAAGGQAVVVGTPPGGGADGAYIRLRDDGSVDRSWPMPGLVPHDVAAGGGSPTWVIGRRGAGAPTLVAFDADGVHRADCPNLPQPSMATPEPSTECPDPVPGAEAWRFAASGLVEGAPGVAADGTVYLPTLSGLLHAVGCDGRQRWIFDYREHSPSGFGAQAFHGSPAIDEDGTIYIGDDILVPNYFFALRPDGTVKWVDAYENLYSQIDASPALSPDGAIFVAAHGWGAGVEDGAVLILERDGRRLRPGAQGEWGNEGPITDSPVVLGDGSAAYLSPPYDEWVLPTGTPPTATATSTPTHPTAHTPTAPVPTVERPGPARAWIPHALVGSDAAPFGEAHGRDADALVDRDVDRTRGDRVHGPVALAQPMPPPWVTQPVPARLRLVRADATPDVVVDLPGLREPSSPATDGPDVWFTAEGDAGARLLAFRTGDDAPVRLIDVPIASAARAAPLLGAADGAGGREVVVLGLDGALAVLDASPDAGTARVRWTRDVGRPAPGAPALGDDGRLYVAAGSTAMALDRLTGEVDWSIALPSPASGSVALAPGGMLYVPTANGEVLAIGTAAGGLDPAAAWPAFRRDARNTGAAR